MFRISLLGQLVAKVMTVEKGYNTNKYFTMVVQKQECSHKFNVKNIKWENYWFMLKAEYKKRITIVSVALSERKNYAKRIQISSVVFGYSKTYKDCTISTFKQLCIPFELIMQLITASMLISDAIDI